MELQNRKAVSGQTLHLLRAMQQNEADEAEIYRRIAACAKDRENRNVLLRLAEAEQTHAAKWKEYTGEQLRPRAGRVFGRMLTVKLFGFTFAVKQMENGEESAQKNYERLAREVPEAREIQAQEKGHESALIGLLDEERLRYVGSMVLGLNDALVEMTGTLAGLTLAMQNTRLIALSGLITGISATLSMAASEFLSAKSEGRADAAKSSVYTGVTYLVAVALLILPYLLLSPRHYLPALGLMLAIVVLILVIFNYYIAVAKDMPFGKRFGQMACISLGVAALSFLAGLFMKNVMNVNL
ncbi:MAG: VIT1/CCC1 transporter family protein [Oscillospiraceae bacterium]|jgi:VIT1/CCC1 family predicted Fe2+/Mn2+ transporter|nr:VIT1/CCC1 transporter family protein [Oscillospiraceae bacterium]MCI1989711.1 VIT1/CCC1 transporter family protein [Oscillospiraceae bacterium]MCI2034314.1 VIT1/CCC1 transporter family protein [Oscillospiraceae bacterium]